MKPLEGTTIHETLLESVSMTQSRASEKTQGKYFRAIKDTSR